MKRRLKKLAVSTVVGNLLMISITLSLAAILVAWAGTSYGAFTSGSQLFFVQRGQALQERIVIENVFFNKTQNRILVFVRNVGALEVDLVAIYVNGTTPPIETSGAWLCTSLPQRITIGAVCEFNLNWGATWDTGEIFTILAATARGNQVIYTTRAP